MADKHIMDEVAPLEFFADLVALHGVKRAAELSGYAVLWGAANLKSRAEIIEWMQQRGISRATAFRVVGDFAAFLKHLEKQHDWHGTLPQLTQELRGLAISHF